MKLTDEILGTDDESTYALTQAGASRRQAGPVGRRLGQGYVSDLVNGRRFAALVACAIVLACAPTVALARCGDVNNSSAITATDALAILRLAVHQNVFIDCGPVGGLLATEQHTCHNGTNGNPIPCDGTGQDGDHRAGAARLFQDNGDGTVLDRLTGLVWEKHSNNGDIHDLDNKYVWSAAFTKVSALNAMAFAGYSDWRVPTQFEVYSLVIPGVSYSALAPEFENDCVEGCSVLQCSCVANGNYSWSSTTYAAETDKAWIQNFTQGNPFPNFKTLQFPVRAVRSGTLIPDNLVLDTSEGSGSGGNGDESCADVNGSDITTAQDSLAVLKYSVGQDVDLRCAVQRPILATGQTACHNSLGVEILCLNTKHDGEFHRGTERSFTDNGDGTIADNRTGLLWEVLSRDGGIHEATDQYTWLEAMTSKIATLNSNQFAGYKDWRLPNVFELHSLLDLGEADPAVHDAFHTGCAPGCNASGCSCTPETDRAWTSTTYHVDKTKAWYADFSGGRINYGVKGEMGAVRAVRGGW